MYLRMNLFVAEMCCMLSYAYQHLYSGLQNGGSSLQPAWWYYTNEDQKRERQLVSWCGRQSESYNERNTRNYSIYRRELWNISHLDSRRSERSLLALGCLLYKLTAACCTEGWGLLSAIPSSRAAVWERQKKERRERERRICEHDDCTVSNIFALPDHLSSLLVIV